MNIGRYVYPDWRERTNWKKSLEYGPVKSKEKKEAAFSVGFL